MPLSGILVYLLIDGLMYWLRPLPESTMEWYSTLLITSANGYAAMTLLVLNQADEDLPAWRWLGRGVLLAFIARCTAIAITLLIERPFVWQITDDVIILIADALVIWGLWQWLLASLSNPKTPTDSGQSSAMIASVFMFFFTAMCVIVPAFGLWGDPAYERAVQLSLSLLDVLGFLFCVRIFFYHQKLRINATPIYIFAVGYGLLCLVDPFAQFQSLLGAYHAFHWINMGWVLAYLLISNAAWKRR